METHSGGVPSPTPRKRQARAEGTRQALLDAALTEFAEKGFEAASTRAIAAAAGTHQPQINYHFESKEALWQATVDRLFARLDETMAQHGFRVDNTEPSIQLLADLIRASVRTAAEFPELNRIMVREATSDSPRLRWIVDHHVRPRFEHAVHLWRSIQDEDGVNPMDEGVFYYSLVGATSLGCANAPEARLLGSDPGSEQYIAAHAEAVVRMFVPGATS